MRAVWYKTEESQHEGKPFSTSKSFDIATLFLLILTIYSLSAKTETKEQHKTLWQKTVNETLKHW